MRLPSCRALFAMDGDASCPGMQRLAPLRRVAHVDASPRGTRYYVGVGSDDAALSLLGFTRIDPAANVVRRIELEPPPAAGRSSPPEPPRKRRRRADPTAASRRAVKRLEPAELDDSELARVAASLDEAWRRVHQEQLKRTTAGRLALSRLINP